MAYLKAARFERVSVLALQKNNLLRLQENKAQSGKLEVLREIAKPDEGMGEVGERVRLTSLQAQILASLDRFEPTGRMVIHLSSPEDLKQSAHDVELENGDAFAVPRRPSTVLVDGAVLNPTSFLWEQKKSLGHFLKRSGGFFRSGAANHAYLIRANGTVVSQGRQPWRCFAGTIVEPGDTIWVSVTLKPLSISNWKKTTTITQILSDVALTALAIQGATN